MARLLLVDDSPAIVEHVAELLRGSPGLHLVGWTSLARQSLALVERLAVDLVLLDAAMPDMRGLEALRRIKVHPRAPKVVVLALDDEPQYRAAAFAAGADGFIHKPDLALRLLPVVSALVGVAGSPAQRLGCDGE
jgi:two-component system response regulator FimZ (fimbrial Z protein)